MSGPRVGGIVERLVAQFSSPYDFLRELIQNAIDARSDLVEVRLHVHPGDAPGRSVFELEIADAGIGMDEAVIDNQLTRLFSSGKRGDQTMAGGFGIGFVSVFAWEPGRMVVQTGRREEAWEVVFFPDRRFEKYRLHEPLEGTTVRLFREGRSPERESIARAARTSLERWCRYCSAEVTFEDVGVDAEPHDINAEEFPSEVAARLTHVDGETTVRMAFVPAPSVIFLRHGLVLAEGEPKRMIISRPRDKDLIGSCPHLWAWVDSPRLSPTMARDAVIADKGRKLVEEQISELLPALRERLLAEIEGAAARGEQADRLGQLHHHLYLEHEQVGSSLLSRRLLRSAAGEPVSAATLASRAKQKVVAIVPAGAATASDIELRVGAIRAGVPVVEARWESDKTWLEALLGRVGCRVGPLTDVCTRVKDLSGDALSEDLKRVFAELTDKQVDVRYARFLDSEESGLAATGHGTALLAPRAGWATVLPGPLWLNVDHLLAREARTTFPVAPGVAVLALAHAVVAEFGPKAPKSAAVDRAWANAGGAT